MEIFEYQNKAMSTCMDTSRNMTYMSLGLVSEVGEFTGKIAKAVRKGQIYFGKVMPGNIEFPSDSDLHMMETIVKDNEKFKEIEDGLRAELGDILWFAAGVAEVMGWDLDEIAHENIEKLASRKQRGVIEGNGDNR